MISIVAAGAALSTLHTQDPAAKQAVLRAKAQIEKAYAQKNGASFSAALDGKFQWIWPGVKPLTKSAFVANVMREFSGSKTTQWKSRLISVNKKSAAAIVAVFENARMKTFVAGDKKIHSGKDVFQARETYVKRGNGWLLQRWEVISGTQVRYIDGGVSPIVSPAKGHVIRGKGGH